VISRPLTVTVILMLLALAGTLVGLIVDPRVITGAPAWLKPLKFAVSISIYSATFVWLLGFVRGRRRIVGLVAWVTTAGLLIEMALLMMQVVRGTTSHFNVSTSFNAAVFYAMGGTIVCVWTANLILAIVLLRQRFADPTFAWALRLGVLISLGGMGVAFLMTMPTGAQLAGSKVGHGMPISGAHSVDVADGGPGIPIVGWSTVGGDLRVPHFVGLHALQLLPLLGWLIIRYGGGLRPASRTALVWIAGLGYLGVVGLLTWQALRGQSIVHPDAHTLTAAGLLLVAVSAATLVVLADARRRAAGTTPTVPNPRASASVTALPPCTATTHARRAQRS
jgi:hypothetical protein